MIEREVKLRVKDHTALRPLLEAMGAARVSDEHETNRILDTADGTLQKRRQVLRVRSADKSTITWKGSASENEAFGQKAREELEISFDADGTEELLSLLGKLGFTESLRYTKDRETWRWQGVEIALDHLEFGDFVEIEGEAGVIQDALHRLQLDNEPVETRSYPELQRISQQDRNR
jgi:adenylate cyclase class 2